MQSRNAEQSHVCHACKQLTAAAGRIISVDQLHTQLHMQLHMQVMTSRSNFRCMRGRTTCWHCGYAMGLDLIWAIGRRSLMSVCLVLLVC